MALIYSDLAVPESSNFVTFDLKSPISELSLVKNLMNPMKILSPNLDLKLGNKDLGCQVKISK